jgi:AmmeMemoRadiSam system protein B
MFIRKSPIAGSWYPNSAAALAAAVDRHLACADAESASKSSAASDVSGVADVSPRGELVALISPHAGLMYSGPVAAHAYRLLRHYHFDVAVLVGPSHFVAFDGVAIVPSGGFETPLGVAAIDASCAAALSAATPTVREHSGAHAREHSLEMQLPFLQRVAPHATIVPLVMGYQTAQTARTLANALATAVRGRRALLVASTDLSHYHDRPTAARLDATVIDCVTRFDTDGLQQALNTDAAHACGGGPTVAVMRAAELLGARHSAVLHYGDSGDVSGDTSAVVGYLAAAFGNFERNAATKTRVA